jgi:hypothetical protein
MMMMGAAENSLFSTDRQGILSHRRMTGASSASRFEIVHANGGQTAPGFAQASERQPIPDSCTSLMRH